MKSQSGNLVRLAKFIDLNDFNRLCEDNRVDRNVVAAILNIESGGEMEKMSSMERPIIRFENHIFMLRVKENHRESAMFDLHFEVNPKRVSDGHKFRLDPNDEFLPFHGDQDKEYVVFESAKSINESAAYESVAIGIAQIMGFNHNAIGYSNAKEMFESLSISVPSQIQAFFLFCKSKSALEDLRSGDYYNFARKYNGPLYAHDYANLIRKSIEKDAKENGNTVTLNRTQMIGLRNSIMDRIDWGWTTMELKIEDGEATVE